MKRKLIYGFLTVIILGGLGLAIWYYTKPNPIEIHVAPVERGTVERTVANTRAGTVDACRRAKLSPSIGGQIATLSVREGDHVKTGKILLELWNDDLKADVLLAKNEMETARARAESACLRADEAQREADRLVSLRKLGAAAEDRSDKAITQAKALKSECTAAKASVMVSEARIGVAEARIDRTRLIAPFDGIIAQINGELSEYLTPSPPGIPTPPAVDLIDNSCFYVTAPIDEVDASEIAPGMAARITMDAFGDHQFQGSVRRIAPFVLDWERQARTVDVEVEFINPDDIQRLLAGYSADVEIILESRSDTLRVPTEAVLDGKRVFIYSAKERMVHERLFEKGISNWDHTEVLSGLKERDRVVTNVDQAGIRDGARAVLFKENP